MIKDFNWLIILIIFGLLIFYSNSNKNINTNTKSNRIHDYRPVKKNVNDSTDLESYKNKRRETDAKVYVGESEYPFQINDNNNDNNYQFGAHSIYEVGRINISQSY